MAPRSDDSLNFEVEVNGRQGRHELDLLLKQVRRLGDEATKSGDKLDRSTVDAAKGYRQLRGEIAQTVLQEQQMARAVEATRAATERTKMAKANSSRAQDKAEVEKLAGYEKLDLASERTATEQIRQRVMLRQQENKDILTQGQLALITDKREEQSFARAERKQRAETKAVQDRRKQEDQAWGAREKQLANEARAQEKVRAQTERAFQEREKQGARDLARQQKLQDDTDRAFAASMARVQKQRNAQEASYAKQYEVASANKFTSAQQSVKNPLGDPDKINATRYALYDVASTAAVVGTAVSAAGVASIVMATQFESSFAEVSRAGQLTGDQIGQVRQELVDLSTSIPSSFEDISKVAQIGAQMNIANDELDTFASTVSRFAATTNVSVDTASIAFGRIANLLDVPTSEFENLGSAIYEVGISSVATESEILSTSQQIAGAAAAYGFTGDQVVGLGAAFASLAIAPEAARGSVTRIFGDIEKAVSEGGDSLQAYADIMKKDVADVSELWQSDPSAFFQELINGLSTSSDLLRDMNAIGAKDVRDVNLLQRLAGNPQLLADALRISNDAYVEGTALSAGYAYTAETLASKLTVLINNIKALGAAAGGPLVGPLKVVVDILTDFVALLADNAWLTGTIVVLSLLVGGFILLKGAQAAAIAGLLALKFVMDQLGQSTGLTSISMRSLATTLGVVAGQAGITRASLIGTATSVEGLKGAAAGLARAFAPLLALAAAGAAVSYISDAAHDAFDSDATKTEKMIGSLDGLKAALQEDTAAYKETGDAVAIFEGATQSGSDSSREAEQAARDLASVLGNEVVSGGQASAQAAGESALAWGDAATAYVKAQLQQSEAFKTDVAGNSSFVRYFQQIGADTDTAIEIAATQGKEGIRRYFAELENEARARGEEISQGDYSFDFGAPGFASSDIEAGVDAYTNSLGGMSDKAQEAANANAILGAESQNAALGIDEAGAAASEATGEIATMSDVIAGLFGNLNAGADFSNSIQKLFSGIYDGGAAFDYLSSAGITNLGNLQSAMENTILYGQTMGLSAADSLVPLFAQLQASGVDTASLLQVLASQPYQFSAQLDISDVQAKLAAIGRGTAGIGGKSNNPGAGLMSQQLGNLSKNLGNVAKVAPRASKGIGGTGKAAKQAAAEVVTLNDYVSDLQKVFKDATQYRFGVQDSLDEVQSKWDDINEEIVKNQEDMAEAAQKVRDYADEIASLRADIGELTAGIEKKRYFLDIAIRYGDSMRAGELEAGIASDETDIAEKQKEIAKKSAEQATAQTAATRATDMSTKSMIEQRKTLGDLYQGYQDIIAEYARSGMSQAQVAQKAAELRTQFVQQATAAGYSKTEIDRYSVAFNDLTYAIMNVPRKITVAADTNPARQALNDFLAQVRSSRADPQIGGGNAGSAGWAAGEVFGTEFKKAAKRNMAWQVQATLPPDPSAPGRTRSWVGGLTAIASGGFVPGANAFPNGGFVPGSMPTDLTKDNMLAMLPNGRPIALQGREAIINNRARMMYGDRMFEEINAMRFKPAVMSPTIVVAPNGNNGDSVVELSSYDRQLLMDIRNASGLSLSGPALQGAVNQNLINDSRRNGA